MTLKKITNIEKKKNYIEIELNNIPNKIKQMRKIKHHI